LVFTKELVGKLLSDFKNFTALVTAVIVQWHGVSILTLYLFIY
jgi:hypothetical protein